ncbi:MAG: hypothetical protein HYU97_05200 [Deltaproteobacteria bacterium]|nr:hypothetical protein [Deltaproteobacteria bacterium]
MNHNAIQQLLDVLNNDSTLYQSFKKDPVAVINQLNLKLTPEECKAIHKIKLGQWQKRSAVLLGM